MERDRAAGVREGNARLVLERPSGRSLPRRAEGIRRPIDRRAAGRADQPSRGDAWGPGGPKPIEPDTSVGGIVAACRPLKTRKGDRMAVFTLEDAEGGVEVIAFPETFPAQRRPHRNRHAGPGARQARARRRVGSDAGVGDPAARQRARAARAREVAIRVKMPADRECSKRSARSSRGTAAIAACRSKSRYPRGRSRCACAPTSRPRSACVPRRRSSPRSSRSSGTGSVSLK